MMLASPVFKTMLQSRCIEGETLRATGEVEIPLLKDDVNAFAMLMNIVHGEPDWYLEKLI